MIQCYISVQHNRGREGREFDLHVDVCLLNHNHIIITTEPVHGLVLPCCGDRFMESDVKVNKQGVCLNNP